MRRKPGLVVTVEPVDPFGDELLQEQSGAPRGAEPEFDRERAIGQRASHWPGTSVGTSGVGQGTSGGRSGRFSEAGLSHEPFEPLKRSFWPGASKRRIGSSRGFSCPAFSELPITPSLPGLGASALAPAGPAFRATASTDSPPGPHRILEPYLSHG